MVLQGTLQVCALARRRASFASQAFNIRQILLIFGKGPLRYENKIIVHCTNSP